MVNVCFCDEGIPDCSLRYKNLPAFPGGSISLRVTTVDQAHHYKSAFIWYCDEATTVNLHAEECKHYIIYECEHIDFRVYSKQESEYLILKSEGPCKEIKKLKVKISFQPCPRGFQLTPSKDKCDCDKRLEGFSMWITRQ